MTFLKFVRDCSICALIGTLFAWVTLGFSQSSVPSELTKPLDGLPARIQIEGGVSGVWLVVNRANKSDPLGKGFDPSYTYLVCDFKPIVKPLNNGKWAIQFTAPIAENLP